MYKNSTFQRKNCEICADKKKIRLLMKRFQWNLHLITWNTEDSGEGGTPEDEKLLEACRQGDRRAQKQLFDLLAPKMYPVCLRYMANRESAQDVLQEGFITLFSRLDAYSGTGSFEGWARKIFVNSALMQLRKTDALKVSDDIEEVRSLASEAVTPVQNLGYKEIMELIGRLPASLRTVFNLYVIEGYTHKDIADIMGVEVATSRSKLQRARVELQEMIKELK